MLIASASLVDRETLEHACEHNKPIVLRVDNILEDGKNRNSGMPRLKEFAKFATVIVYQSEWAKRLMTPYCGNGAVIYNGVDTDIFYPRTKPKDWEGLRIFYSKFSRNEVKQFHEVQYWFREYNLEKQGDTLVLVGRYADDKLKIDHPFEFHNEENYEYKGIISDPQKLAEILRSCDVALLPYQFDCCSNTIIEVQACGLPVIYSPTGGTPEIVEYGVELNHGINKVELVNNALQINAFRKNELWKQKWGLETMGERYHALFKLLKAGTHEV